jgi:hypothetical protein
MNFWLLRIAALNLNGHGRARRHVDRWHFTMHILIIGLLLCLVFPSFARLAGSMVSAIFWLIVVLAAVALFGALSH